MKSIAAQVSLYPLRQPRLSGTIDKALRIFRSSGLDVRPGAMSTVVTGNAQKVFEGLKAVFRWSAAHGDIVMTVTVSNACPFANQPVEPPKRDAPKKTPDTQRRKKTHG
ncbi:MAG: thiamine-binding protein [Nitrospirota bacterium]|nr:thiamine-binding protein [Nitrospirota bacterium]MDE3242993.1 thiamine-binding protein [Nitrospirota bacterium]